MSRVVHRSSARLVIAATLIALGGAQLTAALLPAASATAPSTFLFVNENVSGTNEVRSFAVASDGAISLVGAYSTGHLGSPFNFFAAERAVVARTSSHLYALNLGDGTVSIFQVNTTTGVLTLQGTTPPLSGSGIAVNPAGDTLYVGGSGQVGLPNRLRAYAINSDGTVNTTPIADVTTSVDGLAVSPDGTRVATADGSSVVSLWRREADGSLFLIDDKPACGATDVKFSA